MKKRDSREREKNVISRMIKRFDKDPRGRERMENEEDREAIYVLLNGRRVETSEDWIKNAVTVRAVSKLARRRR